MAVSILGEVPRAQALRRDTAKVGDDIWVSGELGGAAWGLKHLLGEIVLDADEVRACLTRLHTPEPRVALGLALRGVAHAAIDLSDGLLADLGHILTRSGVGAEIFLADLPVHPALGAHLHDPLARRCLLAGGDDYELCLTAPPQHADAVCAAAACAGVSVRRIGLICAQAGLRVRDVQGQPLNIEVQGYDHFAA